MLHRCSLSLVLSTGSVTGFRCVSCFGQRQGSQLAVVANFIGKISARCCSNDCLFRLCVYDCHVMYNREPSA